MKIKKIKLFFLFAIWFFLFPFFTVNAQIVVFPIRDLTTFPPGIDLKLSSEIAVALKNRGSIVISGDKLYEKLGEKGIFATGRLNIPKITVAYELNGATALWGTKIEVDKKKHLYGLVLFATSIPEGKTFWSKVFYYQPEERFLDIGNGFSIKEMQNYIVSQISALFPERMMLQEKKVSGLHIEHFSITPRYVRTGEPVSILLKPTGKLARQEVVIHVDGKSIVLRKIDGDYEGLYLPRLKDGKYPVYMILNGKKIYLDELTVDNKPPAVYLELKGFKKFGKIDYLPGKLFINAGLKEPDSILHWNLMIENEDGDVVFKKFGYGAPILSFNWNPLKANISQGIYEMKFIVTDIAGNKAVLKKRFYYFYDIPAPKLKIYRDEKGNTVLFIGEVKIPTEIEKIKIMVYSPKGYPIGKSELNSLPAEITFKTKYNGLKVRVFMEDSIGNKLEKIYEPKVKSYKDIMEERGWVEDF